MDEAVPASVVEFVELLGWTIGTGVFSITGFRLEEFAIAAVAAGELAIGAWYLWVGIIALYVGTYLMGYNELLPRIRNRGEDGTDGTA